MPKPGRFFSLKLTAAACQYFDEEATKRNLTTGGFMAHMLEVIARDKMVNGVLDDDATPAYRENRRGRWNRKSTA